MSDPVFTRKPNVLAVDDTPGNLVALEAVLSRDCKLITAGSGAEAITILEARDDIDVILMDLQMPVLDGFETVALIKKMKGRENVPVIMITAHFNEDPFVKRGYEAGAIDYFSKPFDPDILRMKVSIYAAFRQKENMLKERELQLRETEELFQAGKKLSSVLEGLPVGVLISDTQGRICQTNGQVSRICKALEPMEGDSYGRVLGWWDHEGFLIKGEDGPLDRALHRGETTHNEPLGIDCVGQGKKTLLCSASPLMGLDDSIVGAVVVIQDVTESKKIEEDLQNRITKFISLGVGLEHNSTQPAH